MSDGLPEGFRWERVKKLLDELRYEVERGLHENEIDEEFSYTFIYPLSRVKPDGMVRGEFRLFPIERYMVSPQDYQPRIRRIK